MAIVIPTEEDLQPLADAINKIGAEVQQLRKDFTDLVSELNSEEKNQEELPEPPQAPKPKLKLKG